ncbi:MAG: signal recognition particle protein [Thermoguttaceae bacterium]|nr:signal recognition particle protein [Thermoguttaceae bacterium]
MFESLTNQLTDAFRSMTGRGRLTESNVREGLELVRKALLEADASVEVAGQFVDTVEQKFLGAEVSRALNPTQQILKIVNEELISLMGPVDSTIPTNEPYTTIMLCGLQGSGKTTTCGKLGKTLLESGRKPMFVAADLQRPAAIDQLEILGGQLGVPVFVDRESKDPVDVCRRALKEAKDKNVDVVILDTAGRLHVDDELMAQLSDIERKVRPDQVYFVVDAMTGQDAVNSAKAFNSALELDGVILTKLDGDARGGAALSVKAITGVPIKFIGVGETLEALEEFHPDRMASRMLGMGDVMTLIEKVQSKFDEKELERQQEQLEKGVFTLDDFRKQMSQASRLGSMSKIMSFIPGMGRLSGLLGELDVDPDKEMRKIGGVIDSMTPEERRKPDIIDSRRKRRIAAGAGVDVARVNELLSMHQRMAGMVKNFSSLGSVDRIRALQQMTRQASANPFGMLGPAKKGSTGKRLTAKEREEQRKRLEKLRRDKKRKKK